MMEEKEMGFRLLKEANQTEVNNYLAYQKRNEKYKGGEAV